MPIYLKSALIHEFTADVQIKARDVVAIVADNRLAPADDTKRSQIVGVAVNDADAGETVEVIVYGIAEVVADGVINAGDPVTAATTAGRVVSMKEHKHGVNLTTNSAGSHSHSGSTGLAGGHSHTASVSSTGDHSHSYSMGYAGSHSHRAFQ